MDEPGQIGSIPGIPDHRGPKLPAGVEDEAAGHQDHQHPAGWSIG